MSSVGEKSRYIYEGDLEAKGASTYYNSKKWALTSTGHFMDAYIEENPYIKVNSSVINMTDASSFTQLIYTTARVSPLSLVYYGLCLYNGNYTVNLHFAEIVLTNYINTFTSLGERIFDVYIQVHT